MSVILKDGCKLRGQELLKAALREDVPGEGRHAVVVADDVMVCGGPLEHDGSPALPLYLTSRDGEGLNVCTQVGSKKHFLRE